MSLSDHIPGADLAAERTERALRLPVGVVSPLWAVFGAAAGVGIAYWWMTQLTRSVNVEAMAVFKTKPSAPPKPALAEVAAAPVVVAEAVIEPVVEASTQAVEIIETAAEDVAEEAVEAAPTLDDLTVMAGIGPKLAAGLAEHGVTSFAQIAAWTAGDIAEMDAALSLKGRAVRDAWVAQAKRLISL